MGYAAASSRAPPPLSGGADEQIDTPDSVVGSHLSRRPVTGPLEPPTRDSASSLIVPVWRCTAWGLPSRLRYRRRWCALTAPFHPYPSKTGGLFSVALCRRVSPPRRYLARCSVVSGRSSRSPWGPGGPLICTRHPTGGSRLGEPHRPELDVVHLQQPVEEQTIVQQHNPHSPPGLRGLTAQRSPHSSRRAEARRRTRSAPNAWQPHAQRALRAPRSCLTGPAGSNEVVRPHSAGLNGDPGLMATTGDRLPSADGQQRDVLAPEA